MLITQQNFKQYFSILRLLHLSMTAAVIVFGLVAHFVLIPVQDLKPNDNAALFVNIAAVYLAIAVALSYWLFGVRLNVAKQQTSLSDKLNTYRAATILRFALIEGAALLTVVFYLLTGNLVLLGIAGIGVVVLLLHHPNLVKLKMDLDLSPADLSRLEDDADMVVQLPRLRRF
jgi:divalent metal cation (Fe/Co/Zn/Cd) transporter